MTLVVLAHGTGNPAELRTVEAVAARVRLPGVLVRTAYAAEAVARRYRATTAHRFALSMA